MITLCVCVSGLVAMCSIMPNASATKQCEAMLSGALTASLCHTIGLYPNMNVIVKGKEAGSRTSARHYYLVCCIVGTEEASVAQR